MDSKELISISLDKAQVQKLKQEALCGRDCAERISIALAIRLLDKTDPRFDQFAVLDEIDYLEEKYPSSRTKPATQFVSPPLFPFWHKHFFSARHTIRNIMIRWNLDRGGNADFSKMLDEVLNEHGDNQDAWPGYLAHRLVFGGMAERHQRGLTGDWIVFAKYNGMNYYLDLATHQEGLEDDAHLLFKKLQNGSRTEFPFLFP